MKPRTGACRGRGASTAAAAAAAGLEVGRGSVVACWLTNRPEFHAADIGAALLGAASFSIYPTSTIEHAAHVLWDAGSRVLITEPAFVEQALAVRASGATALETIVCVGGHHDGTESWGDLLRLAGNGADIQDLSAGLQADDLLTIIYTSGTTGPPKGVELSHRNVPRTDRGDERRPRLVGPDARHLLPADGPHRRASRHPLPANRPRLAGDHMRRRPDDRGAARRSPPGGLLLAAADMGEDSRGRDRQARRGCRRPDRAPSVGLDAVQVAITGAAPCPAEVVEFWGRAGPPLCEVYEMSETTGVATVNPPAALRPGTVGVALPGVEVALSDTGEVLMRGPVVMRGYRNRLGATAEAIDAGGWMHSGDIGVIDEDGYLRIVDRIKELITSAAGKNMSPANIEASIKASGSLIGNVCAIGDAKPYNVALITLDADAVGGRSADDPEVLAEVDAQITRTTERLARVERIKRFTVLPLDWIADGDELTATSKLKRRAMAAKYATETERMSAGS